MEENTKEKNNKKLKILVIVVGLVLLVGVGITIAYFMSRASGEPTTVKAANLSITYTDEQKFNIDGDMNPLNENEVKDKAPKINFTVTNQGTAKTYLEIDLVNIEFDESSKLKDYDFKWALYEGDKKLTTGTFIAEEDGQIVLASGIELNGSASKNYSVYVWINETGIDQSELMGGSFTGTVSVLGLGQNNTLASKILSADIKENPTLTDLSTKENPDRGLYVQKDDSEKSNFGFPTYYYRGSTTSTTINPTFKMNNYVQFGTDKDVYKGKPIIWRIVRINEDGSIRLISENTTTTSHFTLNDRWLWDSSGSTKYIKDDGSDSTIKQVVDTWYKTTFTESTLQKKIQTSSYCNGSNPKISFTCPVGSIIANEKAGLITKEEMIYGGATYFYQPLADVNNLPYFGDTGAYIWTITPSGSTNIVMWNNYYRSLYSREATNTDDAAMAHAVINLKSNVTVLSGSGTSGDPYVIG